MTESEETEACPLLKPGIEYKPDTLDLLRDSEARDYWLECFEALVSKYASHALESDGGDASTASKAANFKASYMEALEEIRRNPLCHGELSVRLLLNLKEICLRDQGFTDLWKKQKIAENDIALQRLREKLDEIDCINDNDAKWTELTKGLLAGNMFDWGARAISDILESNKNFGLNEALHKIQKRPWLVDGLDEWLKRLKGPPHNCAAIFVDNSGVDIVLGVLPFVRQLLIRRTDVIMCANSQPALNDITHYELESVLEIASNKCNVIQSAMSDGRLIVMRNGQNGCCLDLRSLNKGLSDAMIERRVDLIIIEGMGRALHTNLNAKFSCECLKLAVVKNKWLANRLGGEIFSVICQYDTV